MTAPHSCLGGYCNPSLDIKFFDAKKPWNRNLIRFCESKNFLASRQIASPLPSGQGGSRKAGQLSCSLLRQFCFPSQIVQPSPVRMSTRFWSSAHAPARVVCEIEWLSVLSKYRQIRNSALTANARNAKTATAPTESIHGPMLILASCRDSIGSPMSSRRYFV